MIIAYLERTREEIDILPLEADEFAPSQPACQGEHEQGLQAMTARRGKELLYLLYAERLDLEVFSPRQGQPLPVVSPLIPAGASLELSRISVRALAASGQ